MATDQPTLAGYLLGGGGLIAAGSGFKWLWDKLSLRAASREQRLEAREDEYVQKLEARLSALESRDERRESELGEIRTELQDTRAALLILAQEVSEHNPGSAALSLARRLLRERWPLETQPMRAAMQTLRSAESLNGSDDHEGTDTRGLHAHKVPASKDME